jgi:glycosyltransferase involved in cell wall biosynthesis
LIWDHYNTLKTLGHDVYIVNTPNRSEITRQVNELRPDVVHLHYDEHWDVVPSLTAKLVFITSHYPYITDRSKWAQDNYQRIVNGFRDISKIPSAYISCLNQSCMDMFVSNGISSDKMFVMTNGIVPENIRFSSDTTHTDIICVAKLEQRKRQYVTQNLSNVVYVGKGVSNHPRFLGEWLRDKILQTLTDYSGFILLSTEENDSLALKEALIAGLPAIVSEGVVKNIQMTSDIYKYIRVVPESEMNESRLSSIISEHITQCRGEKDNIRRRAIDSFSLESIMKRYIQKIQEYIGKE